MEAALERRLAYAHDAGGVARRQPFDVAENNGHAMVGRQSEQGFGDRLAELILLGPARWFLARRSGDLNLVFRGDPAQLAAPLLQRPIDLVDGDPVHPGEELRSTLKRTDCPPRAQHRFLCDVFGVRSVPQQGEEHGEETVGVRSRQLLECQFVARLSLPD